MIHIRTMTDDDLEPARRLLGQLGYDMAVGELARRLAAVTVDGHATWVAELDGRVVGLLHMYRRSTLDKGTEAIVQSVVVDEACRTGGVGRALMARAERWAAERSLPSIALSSNVARTGAHAFYERLGYRRTSTSLWLRKTL
ncbi:MAG: N-acetyltransferase family protein [Alphaproteobacteria bacterium]